MTVIDITVWKPESTCQLNFGVYPILASGKCEKVCPEEWRGAGPDLKLNNPHQVFGPAPDIE